MWGCGNKRGPLTFGRQRIKNILSALISLTLHLVAPCVVFVHSPTFSWLASFHNGSSGSCRPGCVSPWRTLWARSSWKKGQCRCEPSFYHVQIYSSPVSSSKQATTCWMRLLGMLEKWRFVSSISIMRLELIFLLDTSSSASPSVAATSCPTPVTAAQMMTPSSPTTFTGGSSTCTANSNRWTYKSSLKCKWDDVYWSFHTHTSFIPRLLLSSLELIDFLQKEQQKEKKENYVLSPLFPAFCWKKKRYPCVCRGTKSGWGCMMYQWPCVTT